jgi:hypothetical protein
MNCLLTNTLCIQEPFLKVGNNTIYFPTNVLPVHQSTMDYSIKLFGDSLRNQSICSKLDPLEVYPVSAKKVSDYIGSTIIQISESVQKHSRYHLEMVDLAYTQCLKGPAINGKYTAGVSLGNLRIKKYFLLYKIQALLQKNLMIKTSGIP